MKKSLVWLYPHLQFMDGGTKFLLEITKRLKNDYEITIVTNCGEKDVLRSFKKAGVTVQSFAQLSANNNIFWLFLPLFFFRDFLTVRPYLHAADVLIATQYPSNFLLYLYSLLYKNPYYYYCYEPFPYLHNDFLFENQPAFKQLAMYIFGLFYKWTDILALKNAEKVFTLNEITQKQIARIYGITAHITLMGVDTGHFRHYTSNRVLKKYPGRILITHSTDYSKFKRTDLAIRAISHLVRDFPNVLLLITSTNPENPERKKYTSLVRTLSLEKNVRFLDLIPYKDLPLYYSASLCYLSSSTDSRLGTTSSNLPVKEALACETPAIRAHVTTEDVEDSISGFLVNPKDYKSVAMKIALLIKNKKTAREMGRNGRKTILRNYSWEKSAKIIQNHLT